MIQAHSLPLDSATSPHFNPDKKQMCRSFGGKSVFSRQRFLNPYYHHFSIAFLIPRHLPYISAGLNTPVINRHVFPIGATTISDSNGTLQNSYGF